MHFYGTPFVTKVPVGPERFRVDLSYSGRPRSEYYDTDGYGGRFLGRPNNTTTCLLLKAAIFSNGEYLGGMEHRSYGTPLVTKIRRSPASTQVISGRPGSLGTARDDQMNYWALRSTPRLVSGQLDVRACAIVQVSHDRAMCLLILRRNHV